MSQLSYVVVSTPRSGTGWAHRVYTELGLRCGHEAHYHYGKRQWACVSMPEVWGDASWMAAPFLLELPPGTLVLHQVRDPVAAVASMAGHFALWGGDDPYASFMERHMPGTMPDGGDAVRAAHFWATWHRMIEMYALSRADLRYARYRIEDAEGVLADNYRMITGHTPPPEAVAGALAVAGTRYNAWRADKPAVDPADLPGHMLDLARAYGYYGNDNKEADG